MELAPYQIYRQDGNMWLENIETEERYFEEEETPELLKMLIDHCTILFLSSRIEIHCLLNSFF